MSSCKINIDDLLVENQLTVCGNINSKGKFDVDSSLIVNGTVSLTKDEHNRVAYVVGNSSNTIVEPIVSTLGYKPETVRIIKVPCDGTLGDIDTVTGNVMYTQNGNVLSAIDLYKYTIKDSCDNIHTVNQYICRPNIQRPFINGCCINGCFGEIDFRGWTVEDLFAQVGPVYTNSIWMSSSDGRSITQTGINPLSVIYSDFEFGSCQTAEIPVRALQTVVDDDYIGFALGFTPGDGTDVDADWILIDWRATDVVAGSAHPDFPNNCYPFPAASAGLAVSRVTGTPVGQEFWGHTTDNFPPCTTLASGVQELARANTLGTTGWVPLQIYVFRIEYSTKRLRVWVDNVLEFDLTGDFPEGRLGLYNHSQTSEYGEMITPVVPTILDITSVPFPIKSTFVGTPIQLNSGPMVVDSPDITGWISAQYPPVLTAASWVIGTASGYLFATQIPNSEPNSILAGPELDLDTYGVQIYSVALNSDDDMMGFAIGFNVGDITNTNADYLLIDWWRAASRAGTHLRHVVGVIPSSSVGAGTGVGNTFTDEPPYLFQLERGKVRGSTPWVLNTSYLWRFEYCNSVLRVWINDELEFEVPWTFPNGANLALHVSSQTASYRVGVRYSNYTCDTTSELCCCVPAQAIDGGASIDPTSVVITRVEEPVAPPCEPERVPFTGWTIFQYNPIVNPPAGTAMWSLTADDYVISQTSNAQSSTQATPDDLDLCDCSVKITVAPTTGDDDYIGFTIGFNNGDDTNPNADFLIVLWSAFMIAGLTNGPGTAILHAPGPLVHSASGFPTNTVLLTKGLVNGSTPWTLNQDYDFRFEYTGDRLKIYVDDRLDFDYPWSFVNGANFGLFSLSQAVRYRNLQKYANVSCPCTALIPDVEWEPSKVTANVDANGTVTISGTDFAIQKGSDLMGPASQYQLGTSLDITTDGTTIVLGAQGAFSARGSTEIYDWDGTAWTQRGASILGVNIGSDFGGNSVSIIPDGNTVATSSPGHDFPLSNNGQVRIFEWNGVAWVQKGADIYGPSTSDAYGIIALSDDGDTIVIGAPAAASSFGQVVVFEWNGVAWIQKGSTITGASNDRLGTSVAISSNGLVIAAGGIASILNGVTRVYFWNGFTWVQRGSTINGQSPGDRSGNSIDLSSDGDTIVIGGYLNDENGSNSGHARVFDWNGAAWVQRGLNIPGQFANEFFGWSVSISDDGNIISGGGQVGRNTRVYRWKGGEWLQLGENISDGSVTAISGDGKIVVVSNRLRGFDPEIFNGVASVWCVPFFSLPSAYRVGVTIDNIAGQTSNEALVYTGFKEIRPKCIVTRFADFPSNVPVIGVPTVVSMGGGSYVTVTINAGATTPNSGTFGAIQTGLDYTEYKWLRFTSGSKVITFSNFNMSPNHVRGFFSFGDLRVPSTPITITSSPPGLVNGWPQVGDPFGSAAIPYTWTATGTGVFTPLSSATGSPWIIVDAGDLNQYTSITLTCTQSPGDAVGYTIGQEFLE